MSLLDCLRRPWAGSSPQHAPGHVPAVLGQIMSMSSPDNVALAFPKVTFPMPAYECQTGIGGAVCALAGGARRDASKQSAATRARSLRRRSEYPPVILFWLDPGDTSPAIRFPSRRSVGVRSRPVRCSSVPLVLRSSEFPHVHSCLGLMSKSTCCSSSVLWRFSRSREDHLLLGAAGGGFAQRDSCFRWAVAQLVEPLLCKKNAQSAVLLASSGV